MVMRNNSEHFHPYNSYQHYPYPMNHINTSYAPMNYMPTGHNPHYGHVNVGLEDLTSIFKNVSPLAKRLMKINCIPMGWMIGIPDSWVCITPGFTTKNGISTITSLQIKIVVGSITVAEGKVDKENNQITLDAGVNKFGVGVMVGFLLNWDSGCLSMCVNLDYLVGSVAPWYWVIGCLKPSMNCPS